MATIYRRRTSFPRLSAAELDGWAQIPTSILSDVMHRMQAMAADIAPISPGTRMAGQARTVLAMVADSSIVHAVNSVAEEGDVLVMNSGNYIDRACWGGLATRSAMARGVRGLVMNGAVRDIEEIRAFGFPVYCRGAVPSGPHKGHGGHIDVPVAVGGVSVAPGDIIVGDDDGVAVVPLARAEEVRAAAEALIAREAEWEERIVSGDTMAAILGVTIEDID